MGSPVVSRATRAAPCPVCGSPSKGCSRTEDGLHLCRGEARPGWRRISRGPDNAGFSHFRREDDHGPERNGHGHHNGEPTQPPKSWKPEAEQYAKRLTPDLRAILAGKLGLPVEALDAIPLLGYFGEIKPGTFEGDDELPAGPCWTFPEHDAFGRVTGINRRFANGRKKAMYGHSRGLTLPEGWRDRPGPLLVAEGASDVLALTACGIACIGKPSNTGGAGHLADLLRTFPEGTDIVVVGEWDERPSKDDPTKTIWPGRDGVASTKAKLGRRLKRKILGAYPGGRLKDCRAWILDAIAGAGEELDMAAIGREFLAALEYDTPPEPEKPKRFKFLSAEDFFAADYRPEWIVPRLLVRGQPGIIGGPSKTLKTSVLIDLAMSVAAGVPFLGEFPVPHRMRVAVASGESGLHTLQETAVRVAKARGIADPGRALKGWFHVSGTLPTLSDLTQMSEFEEALAAIDADLILIDPLYLCLGADVDEKSMFSMGNVLRSVTEIIQRTGRTFLVAHHSNGRLQVGEPMELSHLAYSGGSQFARQWILLNRRERYAGAGVHDLWMNVGGSVGHGGQWSLHIEEGVTGDDFNGRRWEVCVQSQDEVRAEETVEKKAAKSDAVRRRFREEETELFKAIDSETSKGQPGATRTAISGLLGWSRTKVADVAGRLIEAGAVEEFTFEKPTGKNAHLDVRGFRRLDQDDEQ